MPRKKGYFKCKQCGEYVKEEESKEYIHITESGKKIKEHYHIVNCYEKAMNNKEERKQMDQLWNYIKHDIFKWDDGKVCPRHLVDRLQGLKSGQKYGHVNKNSKVFGNENGYSYDTILMAFKVCKPMIVYGITDSDKFKDVKHMIDYMMVIVSDHINDVYYRMKAKEESDKRVQKVKLTKSIDAKFINKTEIKRNKVANKLNDLF